MGNKLNFMNKLDNIEYKPSNSNSMSCIFTAIYKLVQKNNKNIIFLNGHKMDIMFI